MESTIAFLIFVVVAAIAGMAFILAAARLGNQISRE
jgi:hypothetical protein